MSLPTLEQSIFLALVISEKDKIKNEVALSKVAEAFSFSDWNTMKPKLSSNPNMRAMYLKAALLWLEIAYEKLQIKLKQINDNGTSDVKMETGAFSEAAYREYDDISEIGLEAIRQDYKDLYTPLVVDCVYGSIRLSPGVVKGLINDLGSKERGVTVRDLLIKLLSRKGGDMHKISESTHISYTALSNYMRGARLIPVNRELLGSISKACKENLRYSDELIDELLFNHVLHSWKLYYDKLRDTDFSPLKVAIINLCSKEDYDSMELEAEKNLKVMSNRLKSSFLVKGALLKDDEPIKIFVAFLAAVNWLEKNNKIYLELPGVKTASGKKNKRNIPEHTYWAICKVLTDKVWGKDCLPKGFQGFELQ